MLPIISEVYNRSINLLTERKGSVGVALGHVTGARGGGFLRQHTHTHAGARKMRVPTPSSYALTDDGAHTIVRQMYLVSIPFVCMGFCAFSLSPDFSLSLPLLSFIGTHLGVPYTRMSV